VLFLKDAGSSLLSSYFCSAISLLVNYVNELTLSLFKFFVMADLHPTIANGKICYVEIPSADPKKSSTFYNAIFSWKMRTRGDGATAFDDGVGEVSGAFVKGRKASSEIGALMYIMVDNVAETIEKIIQEGGRIVQPVGVDAPEITARFADLDGNVFGLYQERG
jgi:predicted enzyme related to lactoylglutathione lyase